MDQDKSEIELLYEEYLSSDDRVIVVDGLTYYKIIQKSFMEIARRPVSLIVITAECIVDGKCFQFCDENQVYFNVGAPAHMRFSGGNLPAWYLKTLTVPLNDAELDDIGMYVRQVLDNKI